MPFNSILLVRRLYVPTLVPRPLTHPAKGIATRYPSKLVTDPSRSAHAVRRRRAYLTREELDQLFSRQIPDDHLAEDMEWIRV